MRIGQTHVSIGEAAAYLGVTRSRVYALIKSERLESVWDYGCRWVRQRSLVRYARDRKAHVERESSRVAAAPCSQSSG